MGKRIALIEGVGAAFSIVCVSTSGCASSGYLTDRCRDGGDIFTAVIGGGLGAKVRAGPIHIGLVAEGEGRGLRGGTFPVVGSFRQTFLIPDSCDLQAVFVGNETFDSGDPIAARRKKHYHAETFLCLSAPPTPDYGRPDCPAYYTQIDVVLAAGPSVRLGFNPGELLDFLLGWMKIDIYGDDLNANEEKADMTCLHPSGLSRKYADGFNGEWYCGSCGRTWPASISVDAIWAIASTNRQSSARSKP